ncbi:MAG: PepSY-like domain-containing protein [Fibrobacter sp.]|nr:PepSY-like domain-containing protein [Fibrobacter sp.]
MKLVRKTALAIACTLILVASGHAKSAYVSVDRLPEMVKTFVAQQFPNQQIIFAEKEGHFYKKAKYELGLDSGAKLALDEDGNWEKVENKVDGVPAIFVPKKIADYIKSKYATVAVTKVDKEGDGYEVELSNRKELKFNKRFKLVKVNN